MDGIPLYEYARKGIPLPRPIESRPVTVQSLELLEWLGLNHSYRWPEKSLTDSEKGAVEAALKTVEDVNLKDDPEVSTEDTPSAFILQMIVSGGTYVRSIVHDLAHLLESAGHVVTLTRSRQGRFALTPASDKEYGCVPWDVFERALINPGEPDEDGWTEWEREVMKHLEVVGESH
jgi:tRNA pseudouridine55 synthase